MQLFKTLLNNDVRGRQHGQTFTEKLILNKVKFAIFKLSLNKMKGYGDFVTN